MENKFTSKTVQINDINADDFHNIINLAVSTAVDLAVKKAIAPLEYEIENLIEIKTYTTKEASVILKVHEQTVKKYCKNKIIKNTHKGTNYIITHKNLMEFIYAKQ